MAKELARVMATQTTERTTFKKVFEDYCVARDGKKSIKDELPYFKTWIKPAIGDKPLEDIHLLDLQAIARKMNEAGRAPRSISYVKSIVRQVFNYAIDEAKIYDGPVPTRHFLKKQKLNNARERYLTPEEVGKLLNALKAKSTIMYQFSLISVFTGMRFGEIAALRWQHINTEAETITVFDTKDANRTVFMNEVVKTLFEAMERRKPHELVFPDRQGRIMAKTSNTFRKTVEELGFNDNIKDRRLKVVFHTLRHSCASWLVNNGVELYTVGKVLGHKSMAMTQRYSHLNDTVQRAAVNSLSEYAPKGYEVGLSSSNSNDRV